MVPKTDTPANKEQPPEVRGLEQGKADRERERGGRERKGPETWSAGQKQAGIQDSTSLKARNTPQDTLVTRTRGDQTTYRKNNQKRAPELKKELEPNRTPTAEPEERQRPSKDDEKEKRKPAKEQDSK